MFGQINNGFATIVTLSAPIPKQSLSNSVAQSHKSVALLSNRATLANPGLSGSIKGSAKHNLV
jgi:hypothetical protein